jgi:hypothetical protein
MKKLNTHSSAHAHAVKGHDSAPAATHHDSHHDVAVKGFIALNDGSVTDPIPSDPVYGDGGGGGDLSGDAPGFDYVDPAPYPDPYPGWSAGSPPPGYVWSPADGGGGDGDGGDVLVSIGSLYHPHVPYTPYVPVDPPTVSDPEHGIYVGVVWSSYDPETGILTILYDSPNQTPVDVPTDPYGGVQPVIVGVPQDPTIDYSHVA